MTCKCINDQDICEECGRDIDAFLDKLAANGDKIVNAFVKKVIGQYPNIIARDVEEELAHEQYLYERRMAEIADWREW